VAAEAVELFLTVHRAALMVQVVLVAVVLVD
jgi:hypothetical protein